MRHPFLFSLCMFGAVATAACNKPSSEDVDRKIAGVNVIDATNLNDPSPTSSVLHQMIPTALIICVVWQVHWCAQNVPPKP